MNTPESDNKKCYQECYQNPLCHQECHQNLDTLGYLESSQEIEIKNIKNSQSIASSVVSGVLSRESKVRPVGIEPTTLDLGSRNTFESKPLETKLDELFPKSKGHQKGTQIFPDERFAELARAWSTLPKSTQLGIIALFDIAKANSLDSGIIGTIGTTPPKPITSLETQEPSQPRPGIKITPGGVKS